MARLKASVRVALGIAFLNRRRRSKAWLKKINLGLLDIVNINLCVLGQLYNTGKWFESGYRIGTKKLNIGDKQQIEYGFLPYSQKSYSDNWRDAIALTKEWKRQIQRELKLLAA